MFDVENVLEQLTQEEKISLLAGKNLWQTVPIPRLDVPYVTVSDGPNGVRGAKNIDYTPSNCFPCGTALALTFNKDLLYEAGQLMAKEAKMKACACILGPTCNIARGPLGGRAFESYSEDPVLSGHMALSLVQGIQEGGVVACLKHFVCNDQEDERIAVDTIVTERALREVYLKPFQMAAQASNPPKAIMTAYNKINGEHVSNLTRLLQDVLRKEWGWKGLVMSDWFGTYNITESLVAGLNLEMPGPTRWRQEPQVGHKVSSREIPIEVVDENVRRVLEFVNDCEAAGIEPGQEEQENTDPAASALLRKVGGESLVLLKNDNNLLPLSASSGTIAVIGPNAKELKYSGGGLASLTPRYVVSPYEGIKAKIDSVGGATLKYAFGANLAKTLPDIGSKMRHPDNRSEVGMKMEFFHLPATEKDRRTFDVLATKLTKMHLSGYVHPDLPGDGQLWYAKIEGYYTAEETGTHLVGCGCFGTAQLFIDDKLVVDNLNNQERGEGYFFGMGTNEKRAEIEFTAGQAYKVTVEFGTRPTSKLEFDHHEAGGVCFGFAPKHEDQAAFDAAVELARTADTVVFVGGLSSDWESEGFDRTQMAIPGLSNDLIAAISKVNKNVVVVSQTGSPISMPWVDDVQAVVQAWYGGNELGNAIADVLFGDVNPSGKLALTFPKRLEDNPSFLNYGATNGRVLYGEDVFVGYKYYEKVKTAPLFAFGHGLSYTTFSLLNVAVSQADESLTVSVDVANTGSVAGAEVVQVYVEHEAPSVIRPVKELRDFAKVHLGPGESKTVSVTMSLKEATSYWDSYKNKWLSEKGKYKVLVGQASDRIAGGAAFEVAKNAYWLGLNK